jgi:hypothetical protein
MVLAVATVGALDSIGPVDRERGVVRVARQRRLGHVAVLGGLVAERAVRTLGAVHVSILSFQADGGVLGRRTDGPLSRFPSTPVAAALIAVTLAAVARDLRGRR